MALGDGIRRNIASVDPSERALLRDAFIELNRRFFPGNRADAFPVEGRGTVKIPGGVTWWFKQDEIHQATHVHDGPEFLPWHREIVNRLEALLRQINPQLSLHYWDWTQDPRSIPNANLGDGPPGTLNLFTPDFMGYGGSTVQEIGEPWLSAGYYVPRASPHRDDRARGTAADPPQLVRRSVVGSPVDMETDNAILRAADYPTMRRLLEIAHNDMHNFVRMGTQHFSFRDPFVFLLHSNVDRLFAQWQTDPAHPERLVPDTVYGTESDLNVPVGSVIRNLNDNVEPWSTGRGFDEFGIEHFTRPWSIPESEGRIHNYKDPFIVTPPCYDTNHTPCTVSSISECSGISAGRLSDRRLQLFATDSSGQLFSRWNVNIDPVAWTGWAITELSTFLMKHIIAAPLTDGRLQLFAIGTNNQLQSCWKITTNPDSDWTEWAPTELATFSMKYIAAGQLSDGRLQLFAIDTNDQLLSCWKTTTNPDAEWTEWAITELSTFPMKQIVAAPLTDGRLQLFAIGTNNQLQSCWKVTDNPDSDWTPWAPTELATFEMKHIAAGQLSDGRLQLFAIDTNNQLQSCWKITTNPDSDWTEWAITELSVFPMKQITAAQLHDRRLQLWAIDTSNQLWTCFKITDNPDADWTPWAQFG